MDRRTLFAEILRDTETLLRAEGARNRGHVTLDPLVKAGLERLVRVQAAENAADTPPTVSAPAEHPAADGLSALAGVVARCTRCDLCKTRRQTVFGTGNPGADLVFVGEAPGADEDRQGEPFVGKAGMLLNDIIVKGMRMRREDVYICNVVKCRPPDNRNPTPDEVAQCEPYLIRQLGMVKPKVICALGKVAAQALLKTDDTVGRMRGKWHDYQGIPLRVTYHPAYLLRNPGDKRLAWEDIQEVMKKL